MPPAVFQSSESMSGPSLARRLLQQEPPTASDSVSVFPQLCIFDLPQLFDLSQVGVVQLLNLHMHRQHHNTPKAAGIGTTDCKHVWFDRWPGSNNAASLGNSRTKTPRQASHPRKTFTPSPLPLPPTSFSCRFFSSCEADLKAFLTASMPFCRALRMLWCAPSASMCTSFIRRLILSCVMRGSCTSTSEPSVVGLRDRGEVRMAFSTALDSCRVQGDKGGGREQKEQREQSKAGQPTGCVSCVCWHAKSVHVCTGLTGMQSTTRLMVWVWPAQRHQPPSCCPPRARHLDSDTDRETRRSLTEASNSTTASSCGLRTVTVPHALMGMWSPDASTSRFSSSPGWALPVRTPASSC